MCLFYVFVMREFTKRGRQEIKKLKLDDYLVSKFSDFAVDFVKKSVNFTKKDVAKYFEGYIEKNAKKVVRRYVRELFFYVASFILIGIGVIFFAFGLFDFGAYLLEFSSFVVYFLFSFFLILLGTVFYVLFS